MSDFNVKTYVLEQSSEELKRISNRTQRIADDAKYVIDRTRSSISSKLVQSGKSTIIHSSISFCASDMTKLSRALTSAAETYNLAEQRVMTKSEKHQAFMGFEPVALDSGILPSSIFSEGVFEKYINSQKEEDNKSDYLEFLSKLSKAFQKITKKEGLSITSDFFSYLSALTGIADSSKNTSLAEISSNYLSLIKSSGGLWNGIYKYFEKTLNPYDVSKLSDKFGNAVNGVSIIGSLASLIKDGIGTYEVFANTESNAYDKSSEIIKLLGSFGAVGGNTYKTFLNNTKSLQMVNTSGVKNQILANYELKFTTSEAVSSKVSKVATWLSLINVLTNSISSGVEKAGELGADGEISLADGSTASVYGALSGLEVISDFFTLGLVEFDAEKIGDSMEHDKNVFLSGDSWAANYINNQENDLIGRFVVATGVGTGIFAKNILEVVQDNLDLCRPLLNVGTIPHLSGTVANGIGKMLGSCAVNETNTVPDWLSAGWKSLAGM